MKILSVDYGDARTGIAISDIMGMLASPVTVIKEWNQDKLIEKIIDIVNDNNIKKIIVGYPKNMDGSCGSRCDKCKELGDKLQEKSGITVIFEDERLTTVMAHDVLSKNDVNAKKRKNLVDAVSAVMILQSYLDKNK